MPLSRLLRPAVAVLCVGLATALGLAATSPSGRAQSATDFARPEVAWAAPTAGRIAADANLTTALGLPECADGSVLSFDRVRFGGRGWGCVDRVTNATTATGAAVADSLNPTGLPTCGDGEVLKSTGSGFACVSAANATAHGVPCTAGQVVTSNGVELSCFDAVAANKNPSPFSFNDLTDQELSTVIASNSVMLSGFDPPLAISVTGEGNPQISINGGPWSSSGVMESVGQTLQVRLTSSSEYATTSTATVVAGVGAAIWKVTSKQSYQYVWGCGGSYGNDPYPCQGWGSCYGGSSVACNGADQYCRDGWSWTFTCKKRFADGSRVNVPDSFCGGIHATPWTCNP